MGFLPSMKQISFCGCNVCGDHMMVFFSFIKLKPPSQGCIFIIWQATRAGKIARYIPAKYKFLEAGLHSSLTLQSASVYKTLVITSF